MKVKKLIHRTAENVQIHFGKVICFFLSFWLIFSLLLIIGPNDIIGWWPVFLICVSQLFFFEIGLRLLLHLSYGSKYRYSIFSYLFLDHPLYGVCLRKNCSVKNLNFLIFDRMVFPPGTPRILDLDDNKNRRLSVNVNSLGFRGKEFSPYNKSSKLRIFCSGGSTTVGTCVDDEYTWCAQLEKYFQSNGFDVEVINGGVPSWHSYHEFLRVKNEVCKYGADIVLLHQGWNEEFCYSSLSLGKKWRPGIIRNPREENNLYCPPNKVLSSTVSLSFYLSVQAYMKNRVFIPNMRFTNPERWKVLKRNEYVLSWFDNLMDTAKLCLNENMLLYTIDYPSLANLGDSSRERKQYIGRSRLTPLFADYQAVSKKRISRVLSETSKIIPCINVDEDFEVFKGPERAELFYDEIHLTSKGSVLLAELIGSKLLEDEEFKIRYNSPNGKAGRNNIKIDETVARQIRQTLKKNRPYLDRFINEKIERLTAEIKGGHMGSSEIPHDRYTTF